MPFSFRIKGDGSMGKEKVDIVTSIVQCPTYKHYSYFCSFGTSKSRSILSLFSVDVTAYQKVFLEEWLNPKENQSNSTLSAVTPNQSFMLKHSLRIFFHLKVISRLYTNNTMF